MDIPGTIWRNMTGCKYYEAFEHTAVKEKYHNEEVGQVVQCFIEGYMPVLTNLMQLSGGHSCARIFTDIEEDRDWRSPKTEQLCDILLGLFVGHNQKKVRFNNMSKMYNNYCNIVHESIAHRDVMLRLFPRLPEILDEIFYAIYGSKTAKALNNPAAQTTMYEEYMKRKYVTFLLLAWLFKPMVDTQKNIVYGKGAVIENSVLCDIFRVLFDDKLSELETAIGFFELFLPEIDRDNIEALIALRYKEKYIDGDGAIYTGLSEMDEIIFLVIYATFMYTEYLQYTSLISKETDSAFKKALQRLVRSFYLKMINSGLDKSVCFTTNLQVFNRLELDDDKGRSKMLKARQDFINNFLFQPDMNKGEGLKTICYDTQTDKVCREGYLAPTFSSGRCMGYFSAEPIEYNIHEVLTGYGDVIFYMAQNDDCLSLTIDDYSFSHSSHAKTITIFTLDDRYDEYKRSIDGSILDIKSLETLVDCYDNLKRLYIDLIKDNDKTQSQNPTVELGSACINPGTFDLLNSKSEEDNNNREPAFTEIGQEDLIKYYELEHYDSKETLVIDKGFEPGLEYHINTAYKDVFVVKHMNVEGKEEPKRFQATISEEGYRQLSHLLSSQPIKRVYDGEDTKTKEQLDRVAYSFNMATEPDEILARSREACPSNADSILGDMVWVQVSTNAENGWTDKIEDEYTDELVSANETIMQTVDRLLNHVSKPQPTEPNWVRKARERQKEREKEKGKEEVMETKDENEVDIKNEFEDVSGVEAESTQDNEQQPDINEGQRTITSIRGNVYTSESLKQRYSREILSQKKNIDYNGPRVALSDAYFEILAKSQDSPAQVEVDDRLENYSPVSDFFEFVGGDL